MRKKVGKIVENTIYILIIIPLLIVTIRIVYQRIAFPENIPDIFGFKMFVVLDENMDNLLKYGDLAITYNQDTNDIKENSLIAFRNGVNMVYFQNTKNSNEGIYEGIIVKVIPKIGLILYKISQPISMIVISCIILSIGVVCIYFAKKLDEKEMKQLELVKQENKQENDDKNKSKEQQEEEQKDSSLA